MKYTRRIRNRFGPGKKAGNLFLPALLLNVLVLGCGDSTSPVATLWQGTLSPVPPSQVSGETAAVTQFGRTEISVEIRLAEPDLVYSWRVESGDCQSDGIIQAGPTLYPPITPGEAGLGSSIATIPTLFKSGSQLAVKVFSTEGASERLASCGPLTER